MSGANCSEGCTDCPTCRGEVQPDAPVMKDLAFAMAMAQGPMAHDRFLGPLSVAQTVRDSVKQRGAAPEDDRVLGFLDRLSNALAAGDVIATAHRPDPMPASGPSVAGSELATLFPWSPSPLRLWEAEPDVPVVSRRSSGAGGSDTAAEQRTDRPDPGHIDYAFGSRKLPGIPFIPVPGKPTKKTCCCVAVDLLVAVTKTADTVTRLLGREVIAKNADVKVTFRTTIEGDTGGEMTAKCSLEWWEYRNVKLAKDDNTKVVLENQWNDLANQPATGYKFSVLDPLKNCLADMTCLSKEGTCEFTDAPSINTALGEERKLWGIVKLKSGCPDGPTITRHWYLDATLSAGGLPVSRIWPPMAEKDSPGVQDPRAKPPFVGPGKERAKEPVPETPKDAK